ncbi:MAG: ribonuclease Z [Bacteroidales bacterium]|nr:ribonuclease Z [Bacteroidales bacterium]
MEFSLTTLGSASAKPIVDRYSSVHVLNARGRLFLIDCCEGAQFQLVRYKFSLMKIDHIFISHLHGDHVFGIFGLLSTLTLLGRTAPLHIYAPRDFSSMLNFFRGHFGEGVKYPIEHHPLTFTNGMELICETKTADVYAFPLNHGIETYGFYFREKWQDHPLAPKDRYVRSAAYCCDTAPFPELEEYVRGADLLLHEATYTEEMRDVANGRFHSTAAQAADLARRAGVGKLIAAHFSSRYKDPEVLLQEARAIFPESYLASEGERFTVPYRRLNEENN